MDDKLPNPRPDLKRIKIERISLLALFTDRILFRPPRGETWWSFGVFYRQRELVGTVTDDPSITIQTSVGTLVSAVDIINTNPFQRLLADGDVAITYDEPLMMSVLDAPAGATTWLADIEVLLARVSD